MTNGGGQVGVYTGSVNLGLLIGIVELHRGAYVFTLPVL